MIRRNKNNLKFLNAFFIAMVLVVIISVIIFMKYKPMITTKSEMEEDVIIVKEEIRSILNKDEMILNVKENSVKKFWDGRVSGKTVINTNGEGTLIINWIEENDSIIIKKIIQKEEKTILFSSE